MAPKVYNEACVENEGHARIDLGQKHVNESAGCTVHDHVECRPKLGALVESSSGLTVYAIKNLREGVTLNKHRPALRVVSISDSH